uniref:Uncharacterized protein n=1 Tax=Acrobeloides nanus TaxID=290746 RepID=A0A914DV14_9BILA
MNVWDAMDHVYRRCEVASGGIPPSSGPECDINLQCFAYKYCIDSNIADRMQEQYNYIPISIEVYEEVLYKNAQSSTSNYNQQRDEYSRNNDTTNIVAIVPHASYSPDKFPCDYALFRFMEHNLSGKVFEDEDDVHKFLEEWFSSKKKSFFHDAFDQLPEIWQAIIDNGGTYIKQ